MVGEFDHLISMADRDFPPFRIEAGGGEDDGPTGAAGRQAFTHQLRWVSDEDERGNAGVLHEPVHDLMDRREDVRKG